MGKKEYEGFTLYSLIPVQDMDMLQFRFSLHKAVLHVPSCMIVDHTINWDLMEKAVNIEIERNDCLRLHFVKTKEGIKQYYLPKCSVSDIPVDDYRGMSEEDAKALLHKRGSKPVLDYLHGEVFRIRFFRSHDGRYGVYLCACHLNMDLAAEFLFYKDLFAVYDALENGKELPKPLDKSEDLTIRDLEKRANVQKYEKDKKFFEEFFNSAPKVTYAGIDGPRHLEAYRKKKGPSKNLVGLPIILFDKTKTLTNVIDADLSSKIYSFAEEQNISFAMLLYLAFRTYLSYANNRMETIGMDFVLNRRNTLADNNCGGNRASNIFFLTNISEKMSFKDAMKETSRTMMAFYAHSDFPYLDVNDIVHKIMNATLAEQLSTMVLSCMPPVPVPEELKDWNPDFKGFSNGHFPMLNYTIVVPNTRTGEIEINYEYNVRYVPAEAINKMHNSIVKILEKGTTDPDITIGEIMDSL